MIVVIPTLCSIIIIISLYIIYRNEKKAFNNGVCPRCNHKLKFIYKDNKDMKHFKCLHCGYEVTAVLFDILW